MGWVTAETGYRVLSVAGLGLTGVEIDHDQHEIRVNDRLDDLGFRWALARAYRRVMMGPGGAPEFRAKLRLVR
jgi:hypothetical protein